MNMICTDSAALAESDRCQGPSPENAPVDVLPSPCASAHPEPSSLLQPEKSNLRGSQGVCRVKGRKVFCPPFSWVEAGRGVLTNRSRLAGKLHLQNILGDAQIHSNPENPPECPLTTSLALSIRIQQSLHSSTKPATLNDYFTRPWKMLLPGPCSPKKSQVPRYGKDGEEKGTVVRPST